jgi:UDP-3-O-[3-hydroxymyristoyl] glucosamine N-acyltransferase
MPKTFVLYGVDSVFSADVAESLRRLEYTLLIGILTGEQEWDLRGIDIVRPEAEIELDWLLLPVVVPWVTPSLRRERTLRCRAAGFTRFEPVLDPTTIVASTAVVGEGSFVNAGSVLGAFCELACGVTVNRNVSIGHHTRIGEFSAIGPGAAIAARCQIGPGVQVGTGAAISPGLSVGANSTIALGAGVIRDVPEGVMVAGSPAQVKRTVRPS